MLTGATVKPPRMLPVLLHGFGLQLRYDFSVPFIVTLYYLAVILSGWEPRVTTTRAKKLHVGTEVKRG